jgi:hypothetical protein
MPGKNDKITFEGCEPPMLFREFAAECMELAQTVSSPEKRALYMKMASVWFQMAQRWEKLATKRRRPKWAGQQQPRPFLLAYLLLLLIVPFGKLKQTGY